MAQDNRSAPPDVEAAKDDLVTLSRDGVSEARLATCSGLTAFVLQEIGYAEPVSVGGGIVLLRTVLDGVAAQAREDVLATLDDYPVEKASGRPECQVAAAAELLRCTDPATFGAIRDRRCRQLGLSWADLVRKRDNSSVVAEVQLRAAICIGLTSARTVALDRRGAELLEALISAIAVYAQANRSALRSLVTTEPPADSSDAPSTLRPSEDVPEVRSSRTSRGKRAIIGGVATLIAAGAFVAVLLIDGSRDRPTSSTSGPGSATSTSTSAPTSPARPTTLGEIEPCTELPADSPWAKQLLARREVVVDGRCDAKPENPVGGYTGPGRESQGVDHLTTGTVLKDICLQLGQETSDQSGNKTKEWLRYRRTGGGIAYGYVSAVWIQGEAGARRCQAS